MFQTTKVLTSTSLEKWNTKQFQVGRLWKKTPSSWTFKWNPCDNGNFCKTHPLQQSNSLCADHGVWGSQQGTWAHFSWQNLARSAENMNKSNNTMAISIRWWSNMIDSSKFIDLLRGGFMIAPETKAGKVGLNSWPLLLDQLQQVEKKKLGPNNSRYKWFNSIWCVIFLKCQSVEQIYIPSHLIISSYPLHPSSTDLPERRRPRHPGCIWSTVNGAGPGRLAQWCLKSLLVLRLCVFFLELSTDTFTIWVFPHIKKNV